LELWHDFVVAQPFLILTTDRMNRKPAGLPDVFAPLAGIVPLYPPGAEREDGYDLWLRYRPVQGSEAIALAKAAARIVIPRSPSPTLQAAAAELYVAVAAMLGCSPPIEHDVAEGAIVLTTDPSLAREGYSAGAATVDGKYVIRIAGGSDIGTLHGVFAWLRALLMGEEPASIAVASAPKVALRMLNHWDNLDRTIERGYAGQSIWDWWKLPGVKDRRYLDYARAAASLGINAVSLNNVSSKPEVLLTPWIAKVRALADIFRPYGIRVFLAARFSAPKELGGLPTADPLDPKVRAWWKAKADEIYASIPDFGGFIVKANSEGQPGPHDYGRDHADGANMLAGAIGSRGIVIWRAFVYSPENPEDRHKQAFTDFIPLDGKFVSNVIVQVKNGAIDFQPREPFHPMFGAMPKTPLAFEVQVTKEYLGFATHLAYLGTMYEEALQSDTFAHGPGSIVAKVADGSLHGHPLSAMAAVGNVGVDRNWCGSHFDQANWYAFGRLAWDPYASARDIAREWVLQTFTHDPAAVKAIVGMMMDSREAVVRYMMPLGLHHLFDTGHHHGPGPWVGDLARPEWNPTYYHQADRDGIGFDRSPSGSNAAAQYAPPLARLWSDPTTTPDNLLLWFHHLPWTWRMPSGKNLWEAMVAAYDQGVKEAQGLVDRWKKLEGAIDPRRYAETAELLEVQQHEAKWWRDACIAYFRSLNGLEMPRGSAPPPLTLEQYRSIVFHYAPGRGG
jgi:alpha-glucuronidase